MHLVLASLLPSVFNMLSTLIIAQHIQIYTQNEFNSTFTQRPTWNRWNTDTNCSVTNILYKMIQMDKTKHTKQWI